MLRIFISLDGVMSIKFRKKIKYNLDIILIKAHSLDPLFNVQAGDFGAPILGIAPIRRRSLSGSPLILFCFHCYCSEPKGVETVTKYHLPVSESVIRILKTDARFDSTVPRPDTNGRSDTGSRPIEQRPGRDGDTVLFALESGSTLVDVAAVSNHPQFCGTH
jgi:hypothetical protein